MVCYSYKKVKELCPVGFSREALLFLGEFIAVEISWYSSFSSRQPEKSEGKDLVSAVSQVS